jgi:predicted Zn-dependent peptidase
MSSRLFQVIRERGGWVLLQCYSFICVHADTGIFVVMRRRPDKVSEERRLIYRKCRPCKFRPVAPAELQAAKEFSKQPAAGSKARQPMVRMAQNELYFGRSLPLEEIIDGVDRVSAEDIFALAQTLFKPGPPALTVLGPVEDQDSIKSLLKSDSLQSVSC